MILSGIISAMSASESAFYAFDTSDAVGQAIVLILGVGSIATWSIMMDKYLELKRARKLSNSFYRAFAPSKTLISADLFNRAVQNPGPAAIVYTRAARKLLEYYGLAPNCDKLPAGYPVKAKYLTPVQREAIRTLLENAVSDRIAEMEARIPTLALAVSVSPLLGLFGTVWGVMVAFCGVAKAGTADIAALAPGVAGALLTTVAGLVVAIPSLIAYNFLTNGIRKDTVVLDNFVEEFMTRIALEQLELEPENTPEPTFSNTLPPDSEMARTAQVTMPLHTLLQAQANQPKTPKANPLSAERPLQPPPQVIFDAGEQPIQPKVTFDDRPVPPAGGNGCYQSEMPINKDYEA